MKTEHIVILVLAIALGFSLLSPKTKTFGSTDYNEPQYISQTTSTVGNYPAVKTVLMASSSARSYALIKNQETTVDLYIHLGDTTSTLANSYRIKPGETFEIKSENLYRGRITAFASSATATAISILEAR